MQPGLIEPEDIRNARVPGDGEVVVGGVHLCYPSSGSGLMLLGRDGW